MRVEGPGFTIGHVERIARDLDLRIEWMAKDRTGKNPAGSPRRSKGFFRIVPTGERWRLKRGRDACLHGYNQFIYNLFRSGATRVETAFRDYRTVEALEDPLEPEFVELRREIEAKYGRQECSCR